MDGALAYNRAEVDIMVLDSKRRPALIAEIKAGSRQLPEDLEPSIELLRSYADRALSPFMILVTLSNIMIWRRDQPAGEPLCTLNTQVILQRYMAYSDPTTAGHLSLRIAAKQWLQDLILHWHEGNPPFEEEVGRIGMLDAIRDGEVLIGAPL